MYLWKQWRLPRTRVRQLQRLGVDRHLARTHETSRKRARMSGGVAGEPEKPGPLSRFMRRSRWFGCDLPIKEVLDDANCRHRVENQSRQRTEQYRRPHFSFLMHLNHGAVAKTKAQARQDTRQSGRKQENQLHDARRTGSSLGWGYGRVTE